MKNYMYIFWIMIATVIFSGSCGNDKVEPVKPPPNDKFSFPVPDELLDISGIWSAVKIEYNHQEASLDVTEYFDELKINILEHRSYCSINGCNSWFALSSWSESTPGYSNMFINHESDCVISINIKDYDQSTMKAVLVNMSAYKVKLCPLEKKSGHYEITFALQ